MMELIEFQVKPVSVHAVRLTRDNAKEVAEWCRGTITTLNLPVMVSGGNPKALFGNTQHFHQLRITTHQGVMTAKEGDWIVRGVRGDFYPCSEDVFRSMYVEVFGE